jgi:ferredoxin
MAKFSVKINKNECIGCGSCTAVCPANFEMGDDGKAKVINSEVEELGCNQLAAENCPVQAISVKPIE